MAQFGRAEHELRMAYNAAIENGVTHFWDRRAIPGVHSDEVFSLYKRAMDAFGDRRRLVAERWARTVKHLSRAYWHEAKIAYLEPRTDELACIQGGTPDEFNSPVRSNSPEDMLNSVQELIIRHEGDALFETMTLYQSRALKHLEAIKDSSENELLHLERSEAAYEYARALECMALALEAEKAINTTGRHPPSAA